MARKQLDNQTRITLTREIESLIKQYPLGSPIWQMKAKKQIKKAQEEYGILPWGYKGLPEFMKD